MVLRSSHGFTTEDEGKQVVTAAGETVGEVVRTENGTAFVRPQRELVVGYGSRLTGCVDPSALFPLEESAVTVDADGQIRIKPEARTELPTDD